MLRSVRSLLAQLIADQRNIHSGKDASIAHAADFLPPEPAEEEGDTDQPEQPAPVISPDAMIAMGAKTTGLPLLPGHGARPPGKAMEAFFGKAGEGS